MSKHIALGLALLLGFCAFAQSPEGTAAQADKFAGIDSTVQLVKLRKQLLQENDAAVEDQSNDSDKRLHGSYIHVTQGYMTTPAWLATLKARNVADKARVAALEKAIPAAKDKKAARELEQEKATLEARIARTEQDLASVTKEDYEPYNYNPKDAAMPRLDVYISTMLKSALNGAPEQYFVRIDAPFPIEELFGDEGFKELMLALQKLALENVDRAEK